MSLYKATIPRALLIIIAIIVWINFFWSSMLATESSTVKNWAALMWGFAAIYANISFFINNIGHIREKREYWYLRAWAFIVAIIFAVVGIVLGQSSDPFQWLMNYTLVPASNASWLTAFFIFIVSYHKYTHFRDFQSFLFVVGLIIATLFNTPMFAASPFVLWLGQWFQNYPGQAAMRAMYMSVAVGMLITIMRTFMGLQRSISERAAG